MKYFKLAAFGIMLCSLLLTGCSDSAKPGKVHNPPPITYKGWTTVKLNKAGTMQIPPTLEVRTDAYMEKAKEVLKAKPQELLALQKEQTRIKGGDGVICQPKGGNEQGPAVDAKSKFAQVKFTPIPVQDKVPGFGQPVGLTEKQIAEFGGITKDGIMAKDKKLTFSNWQPMKSEIINGAECLYIAYDWQAGKDAPVHVDRYTFFNKNVIYTLEIASRISEKDYWQGKDQNIKDIVNTLNITSK